MVMVRSNLFVLQIHAAYLPYYIVYLTVVCIHTHDFLRRVLLYTYNTRLVDNNKNP